jgi:hypothetical protein
MTWKARFKKAKKTKKFKVGCVLTFNLDRRSNDLQKKNWNHFHRLGSRRSLLSHHGRSARPNLEMV